MKRKTKEQFIEKAIKIHDNKYDYSLVNYINSKIKVKIICPIHGVFEQIPNSHINKKYGCPKCSGIAKQTTDEFIQKAVNIHDNKYDYSLVNYVNNETKVKIICPIHGVFKKTPTSHINKKNGCPDCSIYKKKTNNDFIEQSIKIHGNKYDYSLVNYKNNNTKVKIICPIHGIFEQITYNHMSGQGCPYCKESHGEKEILKILEDNKIIFERQKTFKECKYKSLLKFDFYLPKYNVCIEYDGIQHFNIKKYWGGEKEFENIQIRDKIKTNFCNENNIKLFRINFNENIKDKINKLILLIVELKQKSI